jgi:hypothetical protein
MFKTRINPGPDYVSLNLCRLHSIAEKNFKHDDDDDDV